jgi:hypothetical protein
MEDYSACLPKHQAATRVLDTADHLSERFPPMNPKVKLTNPATIVDAHGCILVWYLPDILLQDRQVCVPLNSFQLSNMPECRLHYESPSPC